MKPLDEVSSTKGLTRMDPEEEVDGASKDLVVELLGFSSAKQQVYPRLTDKLGADGHRTHGTPWHFSFESRLMDGNGMGR